MRRIYSAESLVDISHLRNVLESTGIRCEIRNDRLSGAVGEIPFVECWPELWLVDERDALRAKAVLDAEFERQARPAQSWICEACGETIEGQFAECWQCAAGTPEEP